MTANELRNAIFDEGDHDTEMSDPAGKLGRPVNRIDHPETAYRTVATGFLTKQAVFAKPPSQYTENTILDETIRLSEKTLASLQTAVARTSLSVIFCSATSAALRVIS
jgi:hypothetical protein